jgi:phosphomannomutase
MQNKNVLFNFMVKAGSRTYFFNVKETKTGNKYLIINESKFKSEGEYEKQNIIIFEENLDGFRDGLEKAINFAKDKSSY